MKKRKSYKHTLFLSTLLYRVHKAFTAERREQLKQLSQMPDIYERLAHALGKISVVRITIIMIHVYVFMCSSKYI